MHTPPEVTALGHLWLTTYLIGTPLVFGFYAAEATFRASGDTRTPLLLLTASVLVTLILDPVLILGLGPMPAMGIAGAAVAAVGTRALGLAFGFGVLVKRRLVRLSVWDWKSALAVVRIGAPTAATGVFFSAVYVGLTRITTQFGTPALAALGVGHKLEGLAYQVAIGFGLASAAIVGQNLGAGRADRARRAAYLTATYACLVAAVACIAFLIVPEQLVSVFSRDAAVIAAGGELPQDHRDRGDHDGDGDRLRGVAGRRGLHLRADALVRLDDGGAHPARRLARGAVRRGGDLVDDQPDGDGPRHRDVPDLARGPLAAGARMSRIITLLTDFGTADGYVGEVKGTLLTLAPGALLVDVAHDLPAGDVAAGCYVLGRVWRAFPEGTVHLAVVDPGVGSARRALAVRGGRAVLRGARQRSAERRARRGAGARGESGGARRREPDLPRAGRLRSRRRAARGRRAAAGPGGAARRSGAARAGASSTVEGSDLVGEVIHVDRFGTLITNLPTDRVDARPRR